MRRGRPPRIYEYSIYFETFVFLQGGTYTHSIEIIIFTTNKRQKLFRRMNNIRILLTAEFYDPIGCGHHHHASSCVIMRVIITNIIVKLLLEPWPQWYTTWIFCCRCCCCCWCQLKIEIMTKKKLYASQARVKTNKWRTTKHRIGDEFGREREKNGKKEKRKKTVRHASNALRMQRAK